MTLTGTADAYAFIVKEDIGTVTGDDGGDAFVFIDPANSVSLINDFDSSEGDFLVVSASGFGLDLTDGPLSGENFVSGPVRRRPMPARQSLPEIPS